MERQITVTEFLSAFYPDENEIINLRAIAAKGSQGIETKTYKTTRKTLPQETHLKEELSQDNKTRGLYFVVNAGGNKDEEINRFNAFFAENDDLTIEEQHEALDNCPIQPSIRIETKKSIHAYWLINGQCVESEWREIQARLIEYFNGDRSIKNPSRTMRLPYFNHVSFNKETGEYSYKRVEIVAFEPEKRFTVEEMKKAFLLAEIPEKTKSVTPVTPVTSEQDLKSYETWNELYAELGMRIMQQGQKNNQGKYEMRCPVHNGESETVLFFDPKTKKSKCMAECPHNEILKAFGLPEKPSSEDKEQRQSQATLLVNLADDIELFVCQNNEPYATFVVNDHKENWALDSISFKDWLCRRFYLTYGQVVNEYAVKEALSNLAGKAKYEGGKHDIYVRRAEYNGEIYLDLCNENWEVVRITRQGWSITSECPVKFRRTAAMKSLPIPVKNGSLDELNKFLNIHGNDLILTKAWLLTTLQTGIPYPILVFSSQQKSGKSTSAKVLSDLIDPNEATLIGKPKSEEDLFISVSNRLMVTFDNISYIDENFSDSLCRISTGGAYVKRKLHSDCNEIILKAKNPIILNGIGDLTTRSDLLDRSIVINLPTLTEKADERRFWTDFEEAKPRILGALLDAVCEILRNFENVSLTNCDIRMMDFAKVGVAAENSLNLYDGEFVEICNQNYKDSNKIAFENNPVANVIMELVNKSGDLLGSATELYAKTHDEADELTKRNSAFPKNAQSFSNCLTRLAPNLEIEGIKIEKFRQSGTGKRLISIKNLNGSSQVSHLSQNDNEEQTLPF
jgi:DNA-directed RNA polymerase subunit N (RpoN/RPB10)